MLELAYFMSIDRVCSLLDYVYNVELDLLSLILSILSYSYF